MHIRGPQLFSILPASIRNVAKTKVEVFKKKLDSFLQEVPDQPGCNGYVGLLAFPSNFLLNQALTS